jgi:hypothetical protein
MHKVSVGILQRVLDLTWTGNNEIQTTEPAILKFNETCETVMGYTEESIHGLVQTRLYYMSSWLKIRMA